MKNDFGGLLVMEGDVTYVPHQNWRTDTLRGYMIISAKKKGAKKEGAMIKRAAIKKRHDKTRYNINSRPYENM